ncbi:hypothetical protein ALP74_200182 [Pseudomonas coronafaciens pv. garcae]|uniref:Uncharacterized protein n=1 Tax=Pseudomonas coronafaciens pv. garcae TaxID=251653 RepID=A0AB37QM86_9PSED|nr:hypothetical protein ALP74_200182 [Pseudomonas coronafaciens pv. garcae]
MPGQHHRQPTVTVLDQLHQALKSGQRMAIEVMGLIYEQRHWAFVLLHQLAQIALTLFPLGRDAYLFFGGQVVVERGDEGGQFDAVLLNGEGLGHGDLLLCLHHLLKPSQHHGFATADDATERNQAAFEDRALDVFDQLLMVGSLKITGLVQRQRQPVVMHHFNPHVRLLFSCCGSSF